MNKTSKKLYDQDPIQCHTQITTSSQHPSQKIMIESFYSPQHSGEPSIYYTSLTRHAQRRARHRGITPEDIAFATTWGIHVQKQGLNFYQVCKRKLPACIDSRLADKLNNLVVVMDGTSSTVITCYHSQNAATHIRKKQKHLAAYVSY